MFVRNHVSFSKYSEKREESLQIVAITKYLFLKLMAWYDIFVSYVSFRQILDPLIWIHLLSEAKQINFNVQSLATKAFRVIKFDSKENISFLL